MYRLCLNNGLEQDWHQSIIIQMNNEYSDACINQSSPRCRGKAENITCLKQKKNRYLLILARNLLLCVSLMINLHLIIYWRWICFDPLSKLMTIYIPPSMFSNWPIGLSLRFIAMWQRVKKWMVSERLTYNFKLTEAAWPVYASLSYVIICLYNAFCLIGSKPLSKPMRTYCLSDTQKRTTVIKILPFSSRKMRPKCRL